jgi:hypothetical protein
MRLQMSLTVEWNAALMFGASRKLFSGLFPRSGPFTSTIPLAAWRDC